MAVAMSQMPRSLEVWASEYDAVVCHGADDIAEVLVTLSGVFDEDEREGIQSQVADGEFRRIADDSVIQIMQTSSSDVLKNVPIPSVIPITDDDGWYIFEYSVALPARQWIATKGRGHLYSTEF